MLLSAAVAIRIAASCSAKLLQAWVRFHIGHVLVACQMSKAYLAARSSLLSRWRQGDVRIVVTKFRSLAETLELDARLLVMLLVLAATWICFNIMTGGLFLSPRNLWNLSVQTSVTAIIATGMVLVIVSRNIDLSVGSLLAFLGMFGAVVQTEVFSFGDPNGWWISIIAMILAGAAIGAFHGWLIVRFAIPAFIVTLAGLLFWRGAAWLFTSGRSITPLDPSYTLIGGGSIGAFYSWFVGGVCVLLLASISFMSRRRRQALGFETKPLWVEFLLLALVAVLISLFVGTLNAYHYPQSDISRGIPAPVLILVVVAGGMVFLANRTRFGRYIYGFGGNPEAAKLAGINTTAVITLSFAIVGALTAIGAVISTARLGSAPLSIGNLLELQVIAAAVIGGTSLSGGTGTIIGALIGAVFMQSLQNGMVLLGVESSPQQMIVAAVLVGAVWLDVLYRRTSQ